MQPEPWSEWVGRQGEPVVGPYPVSAAGIGYLAEAVEDERLATYVAGGGMVAPRSFVTIASRVPNWRPKSATGPSTFMLAMSVPLPGNSAVNTAIDQTYLAPLRVGDRITSRSTIVAITPKSTRLGSGFLVTERIEHRNDDDVLVARTDNTMFRFPQPSAGGGAEPRGERNEPARSEVSCPDSDFEPVSMPITPTRLAAGAGAVRDFSPLHHDVDYARSAGHRTAFLSYSFQLALAIRALGEWFDGDDQVRRLSLRMKAPMYLGTTAACTGLRSGAAPDQPGRERIAVLLSAGGRTCSEGFAEMGSANS